MFPTRIVTCWVNDIQIDHTVKFELRGGDIEKKNCCNRIAIFSNSLSSYMVPLVHLELVLSF